MRVIQRRAQVTPRAADVLVVAEEQLGIEQAVAAGERPRLDYLELARALSARFPAPVASDGLAGRVLERVPSDWAQAWGARVDPPGAVLALSEDTGLALAALAPSGTRQAVIAHNLTSRRQRVLAERLGWLRRPDRVIVLAKPQEAYLRDRAGLPAEKVRFVHDKVDHAFFAPSADAGDDGFVLSVGAEARDYDTLVEALRRTGAPAVLVPSSLWAASDVVETLPPGVEVRRGLPFTELRALYAAAALVVVSVRPGTLYAAGVNAVLEAMAMAKPLVVTRTPGLDGYLDEGTTMQTVAAGDPVALAGAIELLRSDPAHGRELGRRARRLVETERNLDTYVAAVAGVVREIAPADA